jgi:hypothetical protein
MCKDNVKLVIPGSEELPRDFDNDLIKHKGQLLKYGPPIKLKKDKIMQTCDAKCGEILYTNKDPQNFWRCEKETDDDFDGYCVNCFVKFYREKKLKAKTQNYWRYRYMHLKSMEKEEKGRSGRSLEQIE